MSHLPYRLIPVERVEVGVIFADPTLPAYGETIEQVEYLPNGDTRLWAGGRRVGDWAEGHRVKVWLPSMYEAESAETPSPVPTPRDEVELRTTALLAASRVHPGKNVYLPEVAADVLHLAEEFLAWLINEPEETADPEETRGHNHRDDQPCARDCPRLNEPFEETP